MPVYQGQHIKLREYRSEDVHAIRAWVNDADTVRYLSSRYWMPQSLGDTADFVDHAMRAGANGAYFVIADLQTDGYVGQIDLYSINWKLRQAEMAIVLGNEVQRGKGIGTEAIAMLLQYAFNTLCLERIELEVATENVRAVRCYQRAGFVQEGIKRHAFMLDGEYTDLAVMAVLGSEWRAAQKTKPEPRGD